MTNANQTPTHIERPGLDSLVEDLFGLNLRGLSTIGRLFLAPKDVFDSARVSDWRRKYTPTIRLTFSVITVFMLLSFFWAAEDGMMYQALLAQFNEAASTDAHSLTIEEVRDRLDNVFAAYSFMYPFIYMLIHGCVSSVVFLWGKGTGWVTRVRLYFGLLAVGMSVSLLITLVTPFLRAEMLVPFTFIGLVITLIAYWLTYLRGMWGRASKLGIVVRATSISALIILVDLIVSGLAGFSAGLWVGMISA